jgi:protoporphyrinogen oxidase
MVHGIYAADSRVLSVRSTFPVLWDALQARGSLVLGLLRPARSVRREDAARAEKEAWESLGGDMDAQRKTWSIYGIRGGVETLTKKLEQEIHKLGVDVRVGQTIEKLEPTDDGCRVSHRNARKEWSPLAYFRWIDWLFFRSHFPRGQLWTQQWSSRHSLLQY